MKKIADDYYLGLDIGTDSVGWAVTDTDYNILDFNRKAMWGSHIFDEGQTAEERRTFRCARRRLERRKQRISLLQELFDPEIVKVDPLFFERLEESKLYIEDRKHKQPNSLFNDPNFKDADLHNKYPTIYHLRLALMTTNEKPDIRLVYLAAHHIIKYRGHFLFEGLTSGDVPAFHDVFEELLGAANSECGFEMSADGAEEKIQSVLLNRTFGIKWKKLELYSILSAESPAEKAFADLLAGSPVTMNKLFGDDELKEAKVCLKDSDFDAKIDELEDQLGTDRTLVIRLMKQVYDWSLLSGLLSGHKYVSEAKIDAFEQHQHDLAVLKASVRHFLPEKFKEVFKSNEEKTNYCAYTGVFRKKASANGKKCSQEEFCAYLEKLFKNIDLASGDKFQQDMINRIKAATFMPKPVTSDNSVIPYILHYNELKAILENVSRFYPFLLEKDSDGLDVKSKIMLLDKFRIPYYVGPLNNRSERAWLVRRSNEKVTPWNFEKVVDLDKSSQGFIDNLTSYCTYLTAEKVLPKESLTYSMFQTMNELNTLKINGERIPTKVRDSIIDDLFKNIARPKKQTAASIKKYLVQAGQMQETDELTGIDQDVKAQLKSYVQIKAIVGEKIKDRQLIEKMIRDITIFGEDAGRLKKKLQDYSDRFDKNELAAISKLRYADWGRLSEKFLTGISSVDRRTGVAMNIMSAMERTGENLMEVLNDSNFDFIKKIDDCNRETCGIPSNKITYGAVESLYVSPAVRRSIWRTLRVVQDILAAVGHPPKKIFVETTRAHKESKRTESRKNQLLSLYKSCKDQERDWAAEIGATEEGRLRGKRLFAYYLQQGRCMYCGKAIDLNDLENANLYDIDHIFPQSKIKDDSPLNNTVLVCRECNQNKHDVYPISAAVQNKMKQFWTVLRARGMVTETKFARLTRTTPLTDDELSVFISRQLNETNQSVKAVSKILSDVFGSASDIVYVKGNNVSQFRQDNGFVKCRSINDFHHAKDAYLNIVVGNVYDTKFTKDPVRFLHSGESYNLSKMFEKDVSRNGITAWRGGAEGSIVNVKKYMNRNNVLMTMWTKTEGGKYFDVMPVKAVTCSTGMEKIPIKTGLAPEKYGGFDNSHGSFFTLVEEDSGKKKVRSLEVVPSWMEKDDQNEGLLIAYLKESKKMVNPRIVIGKIPYRSLLEINGFRMILSAKTGSSLSVFNGLELITSNQTYTYFKKIDNYWNAQLENKGVPASDYGLTKDGNVAVYDELQNKAAGTYSKLLKATVPALVKGRQAFIDLKTEDQAKALVQIIRMFQCKPGTSDLESIGGCKQSAKLSISKNIARNESAYLITQSPTGLFENRIDMKKV